MQKPKVQLKKDFGQKITLNEKVTRVGNFLDRIIARNSIMMQVCCKNSYLM